VAGSCEYGDEPAGSGTTELGSGVFLVRECKVVCIFFRCPVMKKKTLYSDKFSWSRYMKWIGLW
jgi:hypothetical protein